MNFNCKFSLAFGLAILASATFFITNPTFGQDEEEGTMSIGSKAPALDIEHWVSNGNGKFDKVTELESGKVYVVEFWATWCGPCIGSMPHLAATQKKFADKNVQIISISDEDMDTVNEFLETEYAAEDGSEESTYGELTSAYCLTTDPDGSVEKDYFRAAGQTGIPCCFIVGKTQHIEWIGHPMEMDEPLEKVVDGSWDREAYLISYKKEQARDAMLQSIFMKMRRGDSEGALELIAEARTNAEGDAETLEILDSFELRAKATPAFEKMQAGEVEEGMALLAELGKNVSPAQKFQLNAMRFEFYMSQEMHDEAAPILKEIASSDRALPDMLNSIAWPIFELADEDEDFSKDLLAAATIAAEAAVKADPENGMILDTLAHLLHHQGDLDQALEIQLRAIKNPGPSAADIKAFLEQLQKEKAGG